MQYMNALKNQWRISQAWMMVSLFLGVTCMFLAAEIAAQANAIPVRLIPQGYDSTHGPITVEGDATGNAEYMTLIGEADLQNYTTWTPKSVKTQTARFVNRMTPDLYAKEGANLMLTAEGRAKTEQSQSLYIEESRVRDGVVTITGVLQVWQGTIQVDSTHMVYTMTYGLTNGVPKLAAFSAKTAMESR